MSTIAKAVITFGIVVILFLEVLIVLSSVTEGKEGIFQQVLFLPVVLVFSLLLLVLIKKWSTKDVMWVSQKIREALM